MEKIYLSRNGQIEGPFTGQDVERLKTNGEFGQFSWIWTGHSRKWVAINPPPPPPAEVTEKAAPAPVATAQKPAPAPAPKPAPLPPTASARNAPHAVEKALQALCHDNLQIVTGMMNRCSRSGGVLSVPGGSGQLTPFGRGCRVWINVLDEEGGSADNVEARVADVTRAGDRWIFEMEWDRPPSLLKLE